jgi:hypothetical protein
VFGDSEAEDDETLTVVVTGTNNPEIEIPRYYGTISIIDDDTPRPDRTVPHDYTGDGKAD